MTLELGVEGSPESIASFTRALRRWAGMPLDECCASCGKPFYEQSGAEVHCYGCREDYDYQRGLVRARLCGVLAVRGVRV
jgi:hypothetical protein